MGGIAGKVAGAVVGGVLGKKGGGDDAERQQGLSEEQLERMTRSSDSLQDFGEDILGLWESLTKPYETARLKAEERLLPQREAAIGSTLEGMQADRARFDEDVYPVFQNLLTMAEEGPQDRGDYWAGQASSAVDTQFGIQDEERRIQKQRMGISPDSPAFSPMSGSAAHAAARATAANDARQGHEQWREGTRFNWMGQATQAGMPLGRQNPAGIPVPSTDLSPGTVGNLFGGASSAASGAATGYNALSGQSAAAGRDAASAGATLANDVFSSFGNQSPGVSPQSTGVFNGPTWGDQTYGTYPTSSDPWLHEGGIVPGRPGSDVKATLEGGEYVIPKEVVDRVGKRAFDRISGRLSGPAGVQQRRQ